LLADVGLHDGQSGRHGVDFAEKGKDQRVQIQQIQDHDPINELQLNHPSKCTTIKVFVPGQLPTQLSTRVVLFQDANQLENVLIELKLILKL
jgi:hypothetical protein